MSAGQDKLQNAMQSMPESARGQWDAVLSPRSGLDAGGLVAELGEAPAQVRE